ncbi:MAG: hypothetical protein M3Q06_07175 [Bacteroidota bacterium]|nr:hypothetical protein [Bacteroidota bacterium]
MSTGKIRNKSLAHNKKVVACKLLGPEFQKRKAEVLAALKSKIVKKEALANGYQFTFSGSDEILDELVEFIKTERACCSFFTFRLEVEDATTPVTLSIIGPQHAKEFIATEMGLI